MSAFVSSPAGLHIGQCQNLIRGERADWSDARYCLAPVIGLGREHATDRDICGACRMATEAWSAHLVETTVAGIVADRENASAWISRTEEQLVDLDRWLVQRGAERASMDDLYAIRRTIRRQEALLEAVRAAAR